MGAHVPPPQRHAALLLAVDDFELAEGVVAALVQRAEHSRAPFICTRQRAELARRRMALARSLGAMRGEGGVKRDEQPAGKGTNFLAAPDVCAGYLSCDGGDVRVDG